MLNEAIYASPTTPLIRPTVHKIGVPDLIDALHKGFADFAAKPSHLIFVCVLYPIVGLLITRVTMGNNLLPLVFPLIAGFALIGPVAAIGFYDVSRRREEGLDATWGHALEMVRSPSIGPIVGVAALLMAIFVAWVGTAHLIYGLTLGTEAPQSVGQFISDLATPGGVALVVVGNLVGAVFAAIALTVSVVSLPLLLDKYVGFASAIATSARCMEANPLVLPLWGAIVGSLLFLGSIPFFVGLAVVLPVLGHATWHLYRKLVG